MYTANAVPGAVGKEEGGARAIVSARRRREEARSSPRRTRRLQPEPAQALEPRLRPLADAGAREEAQCGALLVCGAHKAQPPQGVSTIRLHGAGHNLPTGAEAAEFARAELREASKLVLEALRHGPQRQVLDLGLAVLRLRVLERRQEQLGGQVNVLELEVEVGRLLRCCLETAELATVVGVVLAIVRVDFLLDLELPPARTRGGPRSRRCVLAHTRERGAAAREERPRER